MGWKTKLLKNSLFELIPFSQKVRELKRRITPYTTNPDIDNYTLEQGLEQIDMLKKSGAMIKDIIVLELGTGWRPIIPLIYRLAGVKQVYLVDSQRLTDKRLLSETVNLLLSQKQKISEALNVRHGIIDDTLAFNNDLDFESNLHKLGLTYLAPEDFLAVDIPKESVDIFSSRAVLEHIPPAVLIQILERSLYYLKPHGKMCHIIDNSDHWEHQDKSITRLNFLQFSDAAFNLISRFNPLDYQNRLRHSDYVSLIKSTGFKIELDLSKPDPTTMSQIQDLDLAPKFKNYTKEDLAILTSYLVATKA